VPRTFHVYILSSRSGVLYIGVTGDLWRRIAQHRAGECDFTRRYRIQRLVHAEPFDQVIDALRREKQLKGWKRARKVALIEAANRGWSDLAPSQGGDPSLRSG
jgi:putative endonuclease